MTTQPPPKPGVTPPHSRCARLLLLLHPILNDGEWHSWEEIVKTLAPKVPRPTAARIGEHDRTRLRVRRGTAKRSREQPYERTILSGARTMLAQAVTSSDKWFERRGKRGHKEIRMLSTPLHLRPYLNSKELLNATCPNCRQPLPIDGGEEG